MAARASGPSSRGRSTCGQPWLSSDKLKAVRLLGKQPLDAIDDEDVALVFLASFVLNPEQGQWYWEFSMELNDDDTRRFRSDAATRQLESRLKPADAVAAKQGVRPVNHTFTKIRGHARVFGAPSSRHSAGERQHPRLFPDRGERGTRQTDSAARTITPCSSEVATNTGLRCD